MALMIRKVEKSVICKNSNSEITFLLILFDLKVIFGENKELVS